MADHGGIGGGEIVTGAHDGWDRIGYALTRRQVDRRAEVVATDRRGQRVADDYVVGVSRTVVAKDHRVGDGIAGAQLASGLDRLVDGEIGRDKGQHGVYRVAELLVQAVVHGCLGGIDASVGRPGGGPGGLGDGDEVVLGVDHLPIDGHSEIIDPVVAGRIAVQRQGGRGGIGGRAAGVQNGNDITPNAGGDRLAGTVAHAVTGAKGARPAVTHRHRLQLCFQRDGFGVDAEEIGKPSRVFRHGCQVGRRTGDTSADQVIVGNPTSNLGIAVAGQRIGEVQARRGRVDLAKPDVGDIAGVAERVSSLEIDLVGAFQATGQRVIPGHKVCCGGRC